MMKRSILICTILATYSLCQELPHCIRQIADKPVAVSIKGDFINAKNSNISLSMEWHHHPASLDTFWISSPGMENERFITAGNYRYLVLENSKMKRQMGARHLREFIGESPLKYGHLEQLANGWFQCPDSTASDSLVMITAYPENRATLTLDTLPYPTLVTAKEGGTEITYQLQGWMDFSGVHLPKSINISGKYFNGTLQFETIPTAEE